MTAAAFAYGVGGDDPWSKAFLHGIAAGAVGLILVVMVQLGAKVLKSFADYVFVLATAAAVAGFGVQVPYALVVAGAIAIWWHRPRDEARTRNMKQLGDIAGVFAYLSLLTVGGGMAAFPELKTLTVDTYHWITFPELLHFYSLGQLAPGPNMMMVASIGAVVAGLPGAAGGLDCLLPAHRPPDLRRSAGCGPISRPGAGGRPSRSGLGSVSVGLVLAGAVIMGRGALTNVLYVALAVVVFFLLLQDQDQSGLPDRGVRPDRAAGALARILLRLAVRDLSALAPWPGPHEVRGTPIATTLPPALRQPLFHSPASIDASMLGDAVALRHVVGVDAVEADRLVPHVMALALALAVAVGAGEAVDRPAVLEPLRLALARRAGRHGRRPSRRPCLPVRDASPTCGSRPRCRTARCRCRTAGSS